MSAPHSVFTPSDLKLDAQWMPFSANRAFKQDPRIIVAADGNYFIDDKGRRIFDSLSGLWTCGAGHNRKEIQEAVSRQLGTLDYAPGFQYGHPLAFRLAEEIAERAFSGWSMGRVNADKINAATLLKYSAQGELDPYRMPGAASLALLKELIAGASIVGRSQERSRH